MIPLDAIERTQVKVDPTGPDDDDNWIRVYYSPEHDTPPMPSVSVVKGIRVDPDKEQSLEGWRDRFDGQSKWGRPWWKDQMAFKGYRGTLIHFAILDELADASGDTYYHNVGTGDWGREEYDAEYALKKWSKKAPSANSNDVPYVPHSNKYDGEHAWDKAVRGMKWATRAFKEAIIDGNTDSSHYQWENEVPDTAGRLDPENVIGVEQFVFDTEYGYGGQYDLLYETPDGRTVLSDLKTSSGIRFDNKLQSAAYKRAVESRTETTIDETEIIRVHPDSETVEISRSPEWDRTLNGLEHQFLGLCDQAWNVTYSDALERAKDEIESTYSTTDQTELNAVAND